MAINCEIKAHDLGFSFDLRFYLAHILCDSRCANGINPFPKSPSEYLWKSAKKPILNLTLPLFFCRTIPHLCRRLELRNWNSAIARSIHTIRRNLVSIKMQIFHLPVNSELPFSHFPQFCSFYFAFSPFFFRQFSCHTFSDYWQARVAKARNSQLATP